VFSLFSFSQIHSITEEYENQIDKLIETLDEQKSKIKSYKRRLKQSKRKITLYIQVLKHI
jgi:predicted ribosome quality control (RQC) complex YloA/Tae2 family protein